MRRTLTFWGIALFAVGVLLVPVAHNLHLGICHGEVDTDHNPNTCMICMVAALVMAVALGYVAFVRQPLVCGAFHPPRTHFSDTIILMGHPARGPPHMA